MKPINRETWYWTPERLEQLVGVLGLLAKYDEQGLYFGPAKMNGQVRRACARKGMSLGSTQLGAGLKLLVDLGGLDARLSGRVPSDHKRRFRPDRVRGITWEALERVRSQAVE